MAPFSWSMSPHTTQLFDLFKYTELSLFLYFQTGLSHACGSGFLPILELLTQVEEVNVNKSDRDGNTPLIFAAQAGKTFFLNLKC